ncbi:cytochrome c oxidase assembly protein PET191-domain-containing protein [Phakopsora pachyrhizi]|nr:cytochrome c oxidase assembly protein PET191-domain-containing protein [Phakopsora pachyrhizi]
MTSSLATIPENRGPCAGIKQDLANCLLKSDCVLKPPYRTPKDCLQNHLSELPSECMHLRYAFFDCKRGLLDMRKRFRGLDPSQRNAESDKIS